MDKKTEALKLALECIEAWDRGGNASDYWRDRFDAITAIREALAEQPAQQQEPMREMPSNTRYVVAVEGQALSYWDNIHDAITTAQKAVYSGTTNTTRAIDDLKAGRIAEWSYGFSAVRIYPPQTTPASKPWVGLTIGEIQALIQFKEHSPFALAEDIEAKLREKNA